MRKTLKKVFTWILIVMMMVTSVDINARAVDNNDDYCYTYSTIIAEYNCADDCHVNFRLDDQWNGGYKAEITIENKGSETIHNWCLQMQWQDDIADIWNATVEQTTGGISIIKNVGWNQDIEPGESACVGLICEDEFSGFPENCALLLGNKQLTQNDFVIAYQIRDAWSTGYTAEIVISNIQINATIEDWFLEFDYSGTIETMWNATILVHEGNHYRIQNAGYNGNILPGQSVVIGFNAQGENSMPSNVTLVDASAYNFITPDSTCDSESGSEQGKGQGDGQGSEQEEVQESGHDSGQEGGQESDQDSGQEGQEFGHGSGQEEGQGSGQGSEQEEGQESGQGSGSEEILDREDDDEDGIPNYYEEWIGTRVDLPDTDEDGLSDYEEIVLTGTNPNKPDTDDVADWLNYSTETDSHYSDEIITTTISSEDEDVVKVSVTASLPKWQAKTLSVRKDEFTYQLPKDSSGYVGSAYDFSVRGEIGQAIICFEFPEELFSDPEFDPVICYFNQETQELELVDTYIEGNTANANVNHFSIYLLYYSKKLFNKLYYEKQVWMDAELFLGKAESEVILVIEDSTSIGKRDPHNQRLQIAQELIDRMPEGCRMGIVRCADGAESFTESLTSDKELLKSFLTDEYFKSKGSVGYAKGERLAYSMLDYDNIDLPKHLVFFIDDGIVESDVPRVGTLMYWDHNITKSTCSFIPRDYWDINNTSYSIEEMSNYIFKIANGNLCEVNDGDSTDDLIDRIFQDVYYRIDDQTDSDGDGLADFYEKHIRSYGNKPIQLFESIQDSDDDGLWDGTEVENCSYELSDDKKKVRILAHFVSNPAEPDTDGDGLWDEDELYVWDTSPKRPDTDSDGIADGLEVDLGFDPLEEDGDHDGKLDAQELADGTSPYEYDMSWQEYLVAFAKGFFGGDFVESDNLPTIAGQLIGSFVPFIDVRDVAANTYRGDAAMTGLSMVGMLPVIGDLAGSSGKCVKFIAKNVDNPSAVVELFKFLDKNLPDLAKVFAKSDEFQDAIVKLMKSDFSKMTDAEIKALAQYLKKTGCPNDIIKKLENLTKASSRVLRKNMIAAGKVAPNYAHAAHHIVAGRAKKAEQARTILLSYGVNINSAVNGVFLPTVKGGSSALSHLSLHTAEYYDIVNDLLSKAKSKKEVEDILKAIAETLENGTFYTVFSAR